MKIEIENKEKVDFDGNTPADDTVIPDGKKCYVCGNRAMLQLIYLEGVRFYVCIGCLRGLIEGEIAKTGKTDQDDQSEKADTWKERLGKNTEIMTACIEAFPDQSECVWRALFNSVVSSASQREVTEQMSATIKTALKLLEDNKPEPVTFHGIMPPGVFEGGGPAVLDDPSEPPPVPDKEEKGNPITFDNAEAPAHPAYYIPPPPPPPVVEPAFITVGTTATLLYENQSGKSRRISVSNDSVVEDMWVGTQNVNHHFGNMIPKTERRDVVVPAGRSLWGITGAGTVRARISLGYIARLLKDIFEPTSDDNPVCLLCGSSDLLQTVHLSKDVSGSDDVYVIPKTGQRIILKETCICMKCMRRLVEKALSNYAE